MSSAVHGILFFLLLCDKDYRYRGGSRGGDAYCRVDHPGVVLLFRRFYGLGVGRGGLGTGRFAFGLNGFRPGLRIGPCRRFVLFGRAGGRVGDLGEIIGIKVGLRIAVDAEEQRVVKILEERGFVYGYLCLVGIGRAAVEYVETEFEDLPSTS